MGAEHDWAEQSPSESLVQELVTLLTGTRSREQEADGGMESDQGMGLLAESPPL